jgi:hypothetical protein
MSCIRGERSSWGIGLLCLTLRQRIWGGWVRLVTLVFGRRKGAASGMSVSMAG